MNDYRISDDEISFLRKHWGMIVVLGTIVSSAAVSTSTINDVKFTARDHEQRLQHLEQAIQAIEPIKQSVQDLKDTNKEIQQDIKAILKAVK